MQKLFKYTLISLCLHEETDINILLEDTSALIPTNITHRVTIQAYSICVMLAYNACLDT